MFDIFFGRENLNKSKFIFDNIGKKTILIVPEQYTLEAEKEAFKYLGVQAFIDFEVLSFSRLKDRVFSEAGIRNLSLIDKRGRHMLLGKIIGDAREDLCMYGKYHRNSTFLNFANNLISELKQYGLKPNDLKELLQNEELAKSPVLSRKLSDVQSIFEAYEKAIEDHYVDTEDLLTLFCDQIKSSKTVCENEFWIFGFDVFSPKHLGIIGELIKYSKGVKPVITFSDNREDANLFKVTSDTIERLLKTGEGANRKGRLIPIGNEYLLKKPAGLTHIEKNLYALNYEKGCSSEGIRLVRAANYYNEAENAAAYILERVRSGKYKFKDFLVICNDLHGRGEIYKQVFESYGIRTFIDGKRKILHSPVIRYTISLMNIIANGYRYEDVISLFKTGLCDCDKDEISDIENYAKTYNIRGSKWKTEFVKGVAQYSAEEIFRFENLRKRLITPVEKFHEQYKKARTAENKVLALYEHLCENRISEKLNNFSDELSEAGEIEHAEEIRQAWNRLLEVMDQLVEIMGNDKIFAKDFAKLINTGVEAVEIGLIPQYQDAVTVGTMQRTRTSEIKVMMILGANDGILPTGYREIEIFSEEEKEQIFIIAGKEISRFEDLRVREEKMAIYKNLSKASDELYLSYSISSADGGEERPSYVFTKISNLFSDICVEDDIISKGESGSLLGGRESTLLHLTEHLADEEALEDIWKEVLIWYEEHEPETAKKIISGLEFDNIVNKPDKKLTEKLFRMERGELVISPSGLEMYSMCPFRFFINYGIRPDVKKNYEIEGSDIGTITHKTLQQLVEKLSCESEKVTSPASKWMTISTSELDGMIDEIIDSEKFNYGEGILSENPANEYRAARAKKLCKDSAAYIVAHVRRGNIEKIYTEESFSRSGRLSPIVISGHKNSIIIEGRIDRLDVLPGNIAKIIDYKTGSREFNLSDIKSMFALQLVLYLRAAYENGMKPGGAYYFKSTENLRKSIASEESIYKMQGLSCLSDEYINSLDIDDKESTIVAKISSRTNSAMKVEEFETFMEDMNSRIDSLCRDIEDGKIEIRPKKYGNKTGCDYCHFNGICKFDTRLKGNRYEYC